MPSSNEQPFHAYAGNEPYIFISYAHKDSARVYPIIADWHNQGYRIWYDEGIDPGNEWPDEIAKALEHSSQFVIFVSKNSVASKNVRNEINYALDSNKKFLSVYLEDADLPPGMKLQMGSIQAVMFYRMDTHSFQLKIEKTLPDDTKRENHESYNLNPTSQSSKSGRTDYSGLGLTNNKLKILTIGGGLLISTAIFIMGFIFFQGGGKYEKILVKDSTTEAEIGKEKSNDNKLDTEANSLTTKQSGKVNDIQIPTDPIPKKEHSFLRDNEQAKSADSEQIFQELVLKIRAMKDCNGYTALSKESIISRAASQQPVSVQNQTISMRNQTLENFLKQLQLCEYTQALNLDNKTNQELENFFVKKTKPEGNEQLKLNQIELLKSQVDGWYQETLSTEVAKQGENQRKRLEDLYIENYKEIYRMQLKNMIENSVRNQWEW